jgi:hypothetical protein
MIFQINKSFIGYNEDFAFYVRDYFHYIISLIREILEKTNLSINIIVGNCSDSFNNELKTIKIYINYEHTLVLKEGRDTNGAPQGNIKTTNSDNYLVRIDNLQGFNDSDIVIEYSIPNIENITTSNLYPELSNKLTYIYPSLYEPNWGIRNREIDVLTTFIRTCEPRRFRLLEEIKAKNISHKNVNDCFEKEKLKHLYSNTKILINIHQTDHHHTFEELRVLPALLCGCIIICENSPLKQMVPYHQHLIWVKYDEVVEKCIEIQNNYEYYYNKIFSNLNIENITNLSSINYNTLKNKLLPSYIYIHVCCINNYKEIFEYLMNHIKESGLYDQVKEIRCCILGDYDENIFLDKKIKIRATSDNVQLYEVFTINQLHEDCKNEQFNILYLHTKGVSKPTNVFIKSWTEYMCYFNIHHYNNCIELLKDNDSVGVNLKDEGVCHYAGNFWWSKSEYINKLDKCTYACYNSPEFWLTEQKIGKHIGLWNTNCPFYSEHYKKEEYENKEINPYKMGV